MDKQNNWSVEILKNMPFERCNDVEMTVVPTCQSYQEMIFCAFRYALRRHTYVVKDTAEYIIITINTFDKKWFELFRRELKEYLNDYYSNPEESGEWECDVEQWELLLERVSEQLKKLGEKV